MRIEPTTRALPRQASNRRHRAEAISSGNILGKGSPATQTDPAFGQKFEGSKMIVVNPAGYMSNQRLGFARWHPHVPFIAQYIGQETATETPERNARRHSEFARRAYAKQSRSEYGGSRHISRTL